MYAKKTGESRPQIKVGLPIFLLAKSDQELLESYIRKYRPVARFKNSLQVGRKRCQEPFIDLCLKRFLTPFMVLIILNTGMHHDF